MVKDREIWKKEEGVKEGGGNGEGRWRKGRTKDGSDGDNDDGVRGVVEEVLEEEKLKR